MLTNTAPEKAILEESRQSGVDLVVMGVDRIRGDTLNFGSVAGSLLHKSKVSVLLISNGDAKENDRAL